MYGVHWRSERRIREDGQRTAILTLFTDIRDGFVNPVTREWARTQKLRDVNRMQLTFRVGQDCAGRDQHRGDRYCCNAGCPAPLHLRNGNTRKDNKRPYEW